MFYCKNYSEKETAEEENHFLFDFLWWDQPSGALSQLPSRHYYVTFKNVSKDSERDLTELKQQRASFIRLRLVKINWLTVTLLLDINLNK